ncbi:MAG: hypothetical protein ACOX5A_03965 [Aminivibrio sp.]|jgi:translation initiation factor 1
MAARQKKERVPTNSGDSPLGVSLGALLGREVPPAPPPPPVPEEKKTEAGRLPPRAILARETKGRGGKVVTAISFRGGAPFDMETLAKEIRTALGCGGGAEGDRIILQGDQTERASAWLSARGVKTVKGN